jgi:hypothetical protein
MEQSRSWPGADRKPDVSLGNFNVFLSPRLPLARFPLAAERRAIPWPAKTARSSKKSKTALVLRRRWSQIPGNELGPIAIPREPRSDKESIPCPHTASTKPFRAA